MARFSPGLSERHLDKDCRRWLPEQIPPGLWTCAALPYQEDAVVHADWRIHTPRVRAIPVRSARRMKTDGEMLSPVNRVQRANASNAATTAVAEVELRLIFHVRDPQSQRLGEIRRESKGGTFPLLRIAALGADFSFAVPENLPLDLSFVVMAARNENSKWLVHYLLPVVLGSERRLSHGIIARPQGKSIHIASASANAGLVV